MTRKLLFKKALLPHGWANNVEVSISNEKITEVRSDVTNPATEIVGMSGLAIPGMANVHSHAFQRSFAGQSEYRTVSHDSFWTWRKLMYEFLEKLTPIDIYSIGRKLYSEMRMAGYTTVGEFNYLHHQQDGTPYENVNEMADALICAAQDVGINIAMLPVYYERGGFDDSQLEGGQLRFGSSQELFLKMVEKLHQDWAANPKVKIGFALHSLRAVSIPSAQAVIASVDQILPSCPLHIHVAEQTQEVDDCVAATGQRPVELLLNSFDVNEHWCLIHATHMTSEECQRVAASGAVIGVCPTTEANLGDGIFMAEEYLSSGGRLAIGGDSHVCVNPCEELRMLEYAQRLSKRRRAILCSDQESCGQFLYRHAVTGGAAATGFQNDGIAVGNEVNFNLISLKSCISSQDISSHLLDRMIFSPNAHSGLPFIMEQ